jgi:hypothetical protein
MPVDAETEWINISLTDIEYAQFHIGINCALFTDTVTNLFGGNLWREEPYFILP